ncbi:MAG: small-conductance mechanosensitive channel [Gammaproteobacteria bacterium]|jgi:small-conductance mechanosensitive channel
MSDLPIISNFIIWFDKYYITLLWSAGVFFLHMIIIKWTLPKIRKGVKISKLTEDSALKAFNIARIIVGTMTVATLLIVWGIDFSGLLLISTSLITITGVALFANWSLLSNITAYFILLFQPSYSRGNFIRIFEGDNFVEGTISEVNLFNIKLITDDNDIIIYPNNLLLTRLIMLNPKTKLQGFGKLVPTVIVENSNADFINDKLTDHGANNEELGRIKEEEANR